MENIGNILIISIIIIASILIILIIIEKKLYRKISQNRETRNDFYIKQITNIYKTNPKNILESVNKIAMDFFKEAFGIKPNTDHSKLKRHFNNKNNAKSAEFCSLMNETLYSGKKTNQKTNQKLIQLLIKIIKSNPIFTPKEKEELKKSRELQKTGILNFLKKIEMSCIGKKKINSKQNNSKQN